MQPIYLDYNSTTPVDPDVLEEMLPYFSEKFGNASSSTHPYGWLAKDAVETAQNRVAKALKCEAQQVLFTSGSTEAINMAIKGVWALYSPRKGKHIVTSKTEHKAVLDVCEFLEKKGASVTYLDIDENGLIDLDQLRKVITKETILVSIMHSNNETGVIQPIQKIAGIVHEKNSIFMSDCTQSVGKIPLHIDEMGIDICCVSAHKFYGPKGIGALYYRRRSPRVAMEPLIHGGGHQRDMRSGTLNVPLIVGLGKAIESAVQQQQDFAKHTEKLRNLLEEELSKIASIQVNGQSANRLTNTSSITFKEIEAHKMIQLTNGAMAVSTGSACTSATLKPSHVLQAMAIDEKLGAIRFSLGRNSTEDEIHKVVELIRERNAPTS